MSLLSSGALQQFRNDKNDFFFALGWCVCACVCACACDGAGCVDLSVTAAGATSDFLLLAVLPALLCPVKLLFEPLPMLSAGSLAVAPLKSVFDAACCCALGTPRSEFLWFGCSAELSAGASDVGALLLYCVAEDMAVTVSKLIVVESDRLCRTPMTCYRIGPGLIYLYQALSAAIANNLALWEKDVDGVALVGNHG